MENTPPGRCMFCDAPGVTKAHVFAKSWTGLFGDPDDPREHEVVHDYGDPVTGEKRELKRAKTFALISRKVCGSCNSGWLSKLEETVRPLMEAFAANTPIVLRDNQQRDLSLWASTAALIAMSLDSPEFRFADPSLAPKIYALRQPPEGMQVWLGANGHGHMGWFNAHSLRLAHAPDRDGAWGASIAFGFAVIHIVFHGLPDQRMRLRGNAQRSLRRIWTPRQQISWPPQLIMRPRDLRPLAIVVGEQSTFERAAPARAA